MDFIRRKTISLDGAELTISCLTQKAMEEFQAEEAKLESDGWKILAFNRKVIAYALNRAAGAEEHTEATLKDVLDSGTTRFLFREVLRFSGLDIAEPKAGAPGEQEPSSTS